MDTPEISEEMKRAFASLGGRSGTGDSKRRPKSHYKKMVAARLAKQKTRK